MSIDAERREKLRANAALVVEKLGEISGMDFGLDEASVGWVEGFIERQRGSMQGDAGDGLINMLGSYLGEAIIAAVPGARWDEDGEGMLVIVFPNGDAAFPFNKVAKLFAPAGAEGESIQSFYNVCVNYVATGKLRVPEQGEAP